MTLGHEKLDVYCLSMLSLLGGRGYCVKEDGVAYENPGIDFDTDSDFDTD